MSDITDRILVAAERFEMAEYQGRPTKLLLGRREMDEFDEYVTKQLHTVFSTGGAARRPVFRGMEIYSMDDDEFLGVA